jgi:CxxC motif-containing protein
LLLECMKIINTVSAEAPVTIGDVIIPNILDTGVDIIATNDCPKA